MLVFCTKKPEMIPMRWGALRGALKGGRLASILFAAFLLSACNGPPEADRLEPANRVAHYANKVGDAAVIRSTSFIYGGLTPRPVRQSIKNFSNTLGLPLSSANYILQGKPKQALNNALRFSFNMAFGMGGLFDPATEAGLAVAATDLDRTLAIWGMGEGDYIEIPLMGPSTARKSFATLASLNFSLLPQDLGTGVKCLTTCARGLNILNTRYEMAPFIDPALYNSADSYEQVKRGYLALQKRRDEEYNQENSNMYFAPPVGKPSIDESEEDDYDAFF